MKIKKIIAKCFVLSLLVGELLNVVPQRTLADEAVTELSISDNSFAVSDNDMEISEETASAFTILKPSQDVSAGLGEKITLKVEVKSSAKLQYEWYYYDPYREVLVKASDSRESDSLTVSAVTDCLYTCYVRSGASRERVDFHLVVKNATKERSFMTARIDSVVALSVNTKEANAECEWAVKPLSKAYEQDVPFTTVDEFLPQMKFQMTVPVIYRCKVKTEEQSGYLYFYVYEEKGFSASSLKNAMPLVENETANAAFDRPGDWMYYVIHPQETGDYTFYAISERPYSDAQLFLEETMNADLSNPINTSSMVNSSDNYFEQSYYYMTQRLVAGKTYYLRCKNRNAESLENFKVVMVKGSKAAFRCKHVRKMNIARTESTCTKEGEEFWYCSVCGLKISDNLPLKPHNYNAGVITKKVECVEKGEKTYTCQDCGFQKKEQLPTKGGHKLGQWKVGLNPTCTSLGQEVQCCTDPECLKVVNTKPIAMLPHPYGAYKTYSKATVLKKKKLVHTCTVCGKKAYKEVGKKVKPKAKVNVKNMVLQKDQKFSNLQVSGFARGDSIKSYKSSNKKIVKIDKKGVIQAQRKEGNAIITVTLASGLKKKINVHVQENPIETESVTVSKTQITIKKGKTVNLKPIVTPVTSQDELKFVSSNEQIAMVSKQGVITGLNEGSTIIAVKSGAKEVIVNVKVK